MTLTEVRNILVALDRRLDRVAQEAADIQKLLETALESLDTVLENVQANIGDPKT